MLVDSRSMCHLIDILGFHCQSACTGTYRKTKRHLLRNANLFLYHLSGDPTEGIQLWVEKTEHRKTYVHIYLHSQKHHSVVVSCQFYRLDVTCKQVATKLSISCCNLLFADFLQLVEKLAASLWVISFDNQLATSLLTT